MLKHTQMDENDWHFHAVTSKNSNAFNSPLYWEIKFNRIMSCEMLSLQVLSLLLRALPFNNIQARC